MTEHPKMTAIPTNMTLEQVFTNFAKFGDAKLDGKTITLTNVDIWMKEAKIIDGRKVTTTDTGLCFNKMSGPFPKNSDTNLIFLEMVAKLTLYLNFRVRTINYRDFVKFIEDLAATKGLDAKEIKEKLTACAMPGATTKEEDKKK